MNRDKLFLLDATALLYRAYFSFIKSPLINSAGMNTNAIFGTVNSFLSFVQRFNPEHIIVSFDRKAPTFRHLKSEDYKAHRPPMPDELIPQVEPVKQFFQDIGLQDISLDGYEADDILATLATRLKEQYDIVIVSGDKDYSQLVQEGIRLYDPLKDKMIDTTEVVEKYSVQPEQFVDYLAIVGDSSDNIPGVKGLGPVAAVKLLQAYKTLDGIYEHIDDIQDKSRDKLVAGKESAYLSQELAQMITDVPIETPSVEARHFHKNDLANAVPILTQYEMPTLIKRLRTMLPDLIEEASVSPKEDTPLNQADLFGDLGMSGQITQPVGMEIPDTQERKFEAICVTTDAMLEDLIAEMQQHDIISLDTETTSVDALTASLVGISVCFEESKAYYVPVSHTGGTNVEEAKVLSAFREIFSRPGKLIVGHNLKYDLTVFQRHGFTASCPIFDTMLAAYVLDPGINQYSLDACAMKELTYRMLPITALIGTGKNQISFDLVEVEKACFYSAEDAWVAFRLYPLYLKRMQHTGLDSLYNNIEIPLIPVLQQMESTGVHIDTAVLKEISILLHSQIKDLQDRIYAIAGYPFNINSTQQLCKVLYDEQHLPQKKKTKTGASTDSSVLEELAADYEIASLIIQYRQLTKLDGTYVSALPRMMSPVDKRVHSNFNQTITSTGRLSSSNPNLQNIPIRTDIGRQIRKAFSAPHPDWKIVAADYSQIELRLLALITKDPYLLDAFAKGVDIHRQTAAYIYGIPIEQVSSDQRRNAKTINFGLLYGMGPVKLSKSLGISQTEAQTIIRHYFEQFSSVRDYIQHSYNLARSRHYCETLFGRRLYLPHINSTNNRLKAEAERVALNMPFQGTAADLVKLAMIDIHHQIKNDPAIRMILQVHDELVFEVQDDSVERAVALIKTAMTNALPPEHRAFISLEVEAGVGNNWYEAH